MPDVTLKAIGIADLTVERDGRTAFQMANLAYRAFREPPWDDDLEISRLLVGLGVDLMRRSAAAVVASDNEDNTVVAYVLGYELVPESEDPRDLCMSVIAGSNAFDSLFHSSSRLFYWDTLCVHNDYRRQSLGTRIAKAMIGLPQMHGYGHIARTSRNASSMRALLSKLHFRELPGTDGRCPDRTFWLRASPDGNQKVGQPDPIPSPESS